MKKITLVEQKQLLVDMLNYVTKKCLDNGIRYTLIGGSLIGAIRHKGIIPWDDDIDIVLMPDEYKKLIKLLNVENKKYKLLIPLESPGYYYPFAKLIDKRTIAFEKNKKKIPDYGVYLDIFQYRYISDNAIFQSISFRRQKILKTFLGLSASTKQKIINEKNMFKKIFFTLLIKGSPDLWLRKTIKLCNKRPTNHVVINWASYKKKNEIQPIERLKQYELVDFEGKKAMITVSYDDILKTTFGDYMKLPPKEKRVTHHTMEMYWKENEK